MTARGHRPGEGRAGIALVTAVLFALVVLMVGHGILVFGRTQRWIASVDGARWAQDEVRRGALMTAVAGLDSLPPEGPLHTPWGVVDVRAVSPEVRLLSLEPEPGAPGSGWATLLAAPMPVPRVLARSGAVRVGGAALETSAATVASPDEACPPGLPIGIPPTRVGPLPDTLPLPRLGVLGLDDLLELLPPVTLERLDLLGGGDSACEEAGGFGDPDRPGECSEVWGAGARRGDLTLGGRGQGVLAVSGDLTLTAEARFRGWVWVGGTLRIGRGAELRGLADAGDRFVVEPGGGFRPDGCAGALALEATEVLRIPKRVGPRAWPLFRSW